MKFEDHCIDSFNIFGNRYEEVHEWLDEFAFKPNIGMRHRKYRHHLKGILEIKNIFGYEASLAARRHIEQDLKEEGWKDIDKFPKDEKDYINMGFF